MPDLENAYVVIDQRRILEYMDLTTADNVLEKSLKT